MCNNGGVYDMIADLIRWSMSYDQLFVGNDNREIYHHPTVCKVGRVSSCLLRKKRRTIPYSIENRKCSPMRMLWWFSLVISARAQLTDPFPASIALSSLDGTNGLTINGEAVGDESGVSVSSAGDVNGDGIVDLVIGAYRASPSSKGIAGKSYVIFGSRSLGSGGSLELSSLNGMNGFILNGVGSGDHSGRSVSSAGDVNGDGFADLLIGAPLAKTSGGKNSGISYLVFGSQSLGIGGSIELSSLNGSNGFVMNGEEAVDQSGTSVSSAGDVNGDGIDDFVIGAPKANPSGMSNAGKSYVLFGSRRFGRGGSIELSSLNGTRGFVLNGEAAGDQSGTSVSSAGDVNGDGLADILIGAPNASPSDRSNAGKSYVVFGSRSLGSGGSLELSSLNGTNGYAIIGDVSGDHCGISVSSAGDVNGDGMVDLVIGAYLANGAGKSNAGKSYVVFGSRNLGVGGSFELSSLNGSNGVALNGEVMGDQSGYSVSRAGDANGDGIMDIVIGAWKAAPSGLASSGKTYVVFGSRNVDRDGNVPLSNINGRNGFVLTGEGARDWSGISVSSAGDVNGDGIDDIVIGAQQADPLGRGSAGKSYLIYGRNISKTTIAFTNTTSRTTQQSSSLISSQTPFSSTSHLFSSSTNVKISSASTTHASTEFLSITSLSRERSPQLSIFTSETMDEALIIGLSVGGGVLALSCSLLAGYFFVFRKKNVDEDSLPDKISKKPVYGLAPDLDDENGDSDQNSNYELVPQQLVDKDYEKCDIELND